MTDDEHTHMTQDHANAIKHALVVGASGGIGFALTSALLADPSVEQVHAAVRRIKEGSELGNLMQRESGRLFVHLMDVCDDQSISNASEQVAKHTPSLVLIVNTAGLLHDASTNPAVYPERRLDEVESHSLMASFQVNAVGPVLVAKHFARLLPRRNRAVFANISARVGSISDNRLGGWYSYRASKAAQNMMTRNLSIELARRHSQLICVALHPGTVNTQLSKPFQRNVPDKQLFTAAHAAEQLLAVIDNLRLSDSGQFLAWDGKPISW